MPIHASSAEAEGGDARHNCGVRDGTRRVGAPTAGESGAPLVGLDGRRPGSGTPNYQENSDV
jgi:hypothetical protein